MDIQAYTSDLRRRLQASRATTSEIAESAGGVISASWIAQFRTGHKRNPTVASLDALEKALKACAGDTPGEQAA